MAVIKIDSSNGQAASPLDSPSLPRKLCLAWGLLFLPWLVLLGYLIHITWFLIDDAFISFRYASDLLESYRLVFNPGEYVEDYSNSCGSWNCPRCGAPAGCGPNRPPLGCWSPHGRGPRRYAVVGRALAGIVPSGIG